MGMGPPFVGTSGSAGPAQTCHLGKRQEFAWLVCIVLFSCNYYRCSLGLLLWFLRVRVLLDNVVLCVCCTRTSWQQIFTYMLNNLYASQICRMSWQHLHQPVWLERCLSLSLSSLSLQRAEAGRVLCKYTLDKCHTQ